MYLILLYPINFPNDISFHSMLLAKLSSCRSLKERFPRLTKPSGFSSLYQSSFSFSTIKLNESSSFNSSSKVDEDDTIKRVSNRQKFRNIRPDYITLHKLDDSKLGYASRRKQRVAIAKRFGNTRNQPPQFEKKKLGDVLKDQRKESPYPFKKRGVPLFVASTYDEVPDVFPGNTPPPEIALIGRSNVGKSTLLNALLAYDESYMQKSPVSDKPGETRHLHFYGLGRHPLKSPPIVPPHQLASMKKKSKKDGNDDDNLAKLLGKKLKVDTEGSAAILVDMPGYGFSFMNSSEKHRIQTMSSMYIRERGPSLKRLVLLLDARHGFKLGDRQFFQHLIEGTFPDPRQEEETARAAAAAGYKSIEEAMEDDKFIEDTLNNNTTFRTPKPRRLDRSNIHWKLQIVVTKCDMVDRLELARRIQIISDTASEMLPGFGSPLPIIAVSGKFGNGIVELKKELGSLVPCPPQWSTSNAALRQEQGILSDSTSINDGNETTTGSPVRRKGKLVICKKTGVRKYISSREQEKTVLSREQKVKLRREGKEAKAARRLIQMKHQREQERKKASNSQSEGKSNIEPEITKKPRWRDSGRTHGVPRNSSRAGVSGATEVRMRSGQSNRMDNHNVTSDFPSPPNRRARRAEMHKNDVSSHRGSRPSYRNSSQSVRDDYDSESGSDSLAGSGSGENSSGGRRRMPRSTPTRRKRVAF